MSTINLWLTLDDDLAWLEGKRVYKVIHEINRLNELILRANAQVTLVQRCHVLARVVKSICYMDTRLVATHCIWVDDVDERKQLV